MATGLRDEHVTPLTSAQYAAMCSRMVRSFITQVLDDPRIARKEMRILLQHKTAVEALPNFELLVRNSGRDDLAAEVRDGCVWLVGR